MTVCIRRNLHYYRTEFFAKICIGVVTHDVIKPDNKLKRKRTTGLEAVLTLLRAAFSASASTMSTSSGSPAYVLANVIVGGGPLAEPVLTKDSDDHMQCGSRINCW
jgi:hypothetical protein